MKEDFLNFMSRLMSYAAYLVCFTLYTKMLQVETSTCIDMERRCDMPHNQIAWTMRIADMVGKGYQKPQRYRLGCEEFSTDLSPLLCMNSDGRCVVADQRDGDVCSLACSRVRVRMRLFQGVASDAIITWATSKWRHSETCVRYVWLYGDVSSLAKA